MVSIGPKIQITGEDSYRLALRRIIQETKELNSEMDLMVTKFDKNTTALEKSTRMHEMYAKQIEQSQRQLSKIEEGLSKANEKHNKAIELYDKTAKRVETLTAQQDKYAKGLEYIEKCGGKGNATWQVMKEKLEDVNKELQVAETDLAKASDEVERSGRVLADWETTANKAEMELENLKHGFEDTKPIKVWGAEFQAVGEKMEDFGEMLSKYVSVPLAGLATASVAAAAQFEDGMAKIYTIAMDSTEPMEKMRTEIVQLSNDTGFALDDLAEATYQTVSASVEATKATDFMAHAVKLARAGFTTTTRAVDILTTVMNSYGKETYDVEYLTDLLLKTQNDGKVVIDQLASSIGVIIPLAANYHVGIEQIAAAYATMTKQGVPAERATTFMRALFTELEKQGKGVSKVLKDETGKSFAQLMDAGWSLADVLELLYNKMDKNSESYQQLFKNVRSGQAAASLAADDFGILNTELDRMQNVAGLTDRALEQMETPALKAKRAVNQLKNSSVELGESMIQKFSPMFEKGIDVIRKATDAFNKLSDGSKDTIINMGGLLTVLPPLVTVGGKLLKYVGALMAGTASLTPIVAGLTVAFVGAYTAAKVQAQEEQALIEAQWGMSDATKQNITDLEKLKTKHDELQTTLHEEWINTVNNAGVAEQLALKYDSLIDSTGNVKAGMEQLAETLLGQIAEALGMDVQDVQALIDEHGLLHGAIMQTIEDYKQEAAVAAFKRELEEATYRQVEAERINAEVSAELAAQADKLTEANQRMRDAKQAITDAESKGLPVTQEMWDAYSKAADEASAATNAYRDMVNAQSESAAEAQKASEDMEYWAGKIADVGKEAEDTADKVEQSAKDGETAVKTSVDNSVTAIKNGDTEGAALQFVKGFAGGIDKYAYMATSAAGNMGANASKALRNKLQIASPSKVTEEIGDYFVEGFANSISDGISELEYLGEKLGASAMNGLSLGSYMPESYGNTYNNKTVSAPISLSVTVEGGNVSDPESFTRSIAENLAELLQSESEVFA